MTAKTLQRSENSDNKGGLASESLAGLGIAFDPEHASIYAQRVADAEDVYVSHSGAMFRPITQLEKDSLTGDDATTNPVDHSHFPGAGVSAANADTLNWRKVANAEAITTYDSVRALIGGYSPGDMVIGLNGLTYRLNENTLYDLGQTDNATTRDALTPDVRHGFIRQMNVGAGRVWTWEGETQTWTNTGVDVIPAPLIGDQTVNPLSILNDYAHQYSEWVGIQFALDRKVSMEMFGGGPSKSGAVNAAAMKQCIRLSELFGYNIEGRRGTYNIEGDILFDYDRYEIYGNQMELIINNGGLIMNGDSIDGVWGGKLRDLSLTRTGTAGPALKFVGSQIERFNIRWSIGQIFINGSTGDGIQISGCFVGAFIAPIVRQCDGAALHLLPNADEQLSSNAITLLGGDLQNNLKGIVASDTKAINLKNTTIQGNKQEAIWLRGDNRNFHMDGGYMENNAKDYATFYDYDEVTDSWIDSTTATTDDYLCDVRIGDAAWTGDVNRIINISDLWASDGNNSNTHFAVIEGAQIGLVFDRINFWSYAAAPIRQIERASSLATGFARDCKRYTSSPAETQGNQMFRDATSDLYTVNT